MQITKLGHCCLVLEVGDTKILTDPGTFTTAQDTLTDVNIVLITHEHADHFHLESVKTVLANNKEAVVVTNASVGRLLTEAGIPFVLVADGEVQEVLGVTIEGFGREHARIYGDVGNVENTAYLVENTFYFPGDNFHVPGKPVDILALPVAGPWMKIADAIDFARAVEARVAFGVHDGMLVPSFRGYGAQLMQKFVPKTIYVSLADGESREF